MALPQRVGLCVDDKELDAQPLKDGVCVAQSLDDPVAVLLPL